MARSYVLDSRRQFRGGRSVDLDLGQKVCALPSAVVACKNLHI